jgi:uncharacterized protein (DUF1330 family)
MLTAARTPGSGEVLMAFEITMGLFVADRENYAQYRREIAPLLEAAGGAFRYDFEVANTLKNESGRDMNRVFVLRFPEREAKNRFFGDPRYQEIRRRLFEIAVTSAVVIAEYAADG